MRFRDIIGQEEVKRHLCLSVRKGRVPHALMLTGIEGVGKLQLAVAYAQYLNCPDRTEDDSCGVCPVCRQFEQLQHPDLHFVFPVVKSDKGDTSDVYAGEFRQLLTEARYFSSEEWYGAIKADNKQGMIYEKESQEILRKLSLKSFSNGYKVMIIWQPEKMNATCANKILKLLEEPPEKTVFLLVTEHPGQLLPTILSRVQQIQVPRLKDEDLLPCFPKDIVRISSGSYLAAKRLQSESEERERHFADFTSLMRCAWKVAHRKDYSALLELRAWSYEMADSKVGRERQKRFLQYAQRQIRENHITNFLVPEAVYQTSEEEAFSRNFARFVSEANAEAIMNELTKAERQIEQNANAKIVFFDLCLQMIVLIKKA